MIFSGEHDDNIEHLNKKRHQIISKGVCLVSAIQNKNDAKFLVQQSLAEAPHLNPQQLNIKIIKNLTGKEAFIPSKTEIKNIVKKSKASSGINMDYLSQMKNMETQNNEPSY